MAGTLFIVQIVLAVMVTISVLLQKSSSMGLGAYSGSNESVFGAKGPGAFLAKITMTLGVLFVINTLTLGYLYNQDKNQSVIDNMDSKSLIPSAPKLPTTNNTPTAPSAPATK
jgi:preprotein translocase subunit SecG